MPVASTHWAIAAPFQPASPELPRLCVDNALERATLAASAALAGFPAINAVARDTWQLWQPGAAGAVLTATFAAAEPVDYVLIARHNLGSARITATLEIKPDGGAFAEAATLAPSHDGPILLPLALTAATAEIRLTLGGEAPAIIGLMMAGEAVTMPRKMRGSITPLWLARQTSVIPQTSEAGEALGAIVTRRGVDLAPSWDYLPATFYETRLRPLAGRLPGLLIGFAWSPLKHPDEVALGVVAGDLTGDHMRGIPYYTAGLRLRGVSIGGVD